MARRKTEELLEDLEPTTEEQDLWDFLDTVGDSATEVDICQMLPGNRRPYRTTEIFSVFRENPYLYLRETLGEGKYLVKFKGSDKKIRRTKVIEVGAAPGTVQTTPPPMNGDGRSDFLREQLVMQQNLITALITSMKPPEPIDVGSLLQGIGALAPKSNVSDPAAMLTAVATVFTTLRGPEKDEDWLTRAKTIIELAQSLQPGNGGEDSGWSVLKEVGKEVARKIDIGALSIGRSDIAVVSPVGSQARPASLAVPADDAGTRTGARAGMETSRVETLGSVEKMGSVEQWLRAALQYLKTKAALNKDPGVYVEHILDDPEEPQNAALCEAIRKGATLENLFTFDPEIGNNPFYRGWFERLYEGLYTEIAQTMDTSRSGGNQGDASGHETTGTGGQPVTGDTATRTIVPRA